MVEIKELEKTLVGGLLIDPDKFVHVNVRAEDFVFDTTKKAFIEIKKLWEKKIPVDVYELSKVGLSPSWLAETTDLGSPSRIPYISAEIIKQSQKRRIINSLEQIKKESFWAENETILSEILELYNSENISRNKQSDIKSVLDRFDKFQKENRKRGCLGIDTGFDFLRNKYVQYVPGHIWAIGGYTSVGKSASMFEMLARVDDNVKTCIISTEMTQEQIIGRMLARKTGFHSQVIMSGNIHDSRVKDENKAKKELLKKKINIYEDVYYLHDIVSILRKKSMQGGLDIAYIDYIQNCKVDGAKNEYQAMGMIAKTLQKTAKDLRCTIIILSQISNAAAREDNGLLEFKGAGDISAVADFGIWLTKNPDDRSQILWDCRKNRHGQTGAQVFQFSDGWTRLNEIDSVKNR